jgi:hypothetical protein
MAEEKYVDFSTEVTTTFNTISITSTYISSDSDWILASTTWNDQGIWDDDSYWND